MKPASPLVALVVFAALGQSACTRLKMLDTHEIGRYTETKASLPAVTFSAWTNLAGARSNTPYPGEVLTELYLNRDGREELVWRGLGTRWDMELVAGEYRLVVLEVYEGDESRPPNGQNEVSFTLADGDRADLRLLVEQVPWGAVIAVGAVVALVVTVVVVASMDNGRPPPRPPPIPRRAPPPPVMHPPVIVVFGPPRIWVPLSLWVDVDPYEDWSYNPERVVAGPAVERVSVPGADHPEGEVRLVFTRPLDPFTVAPDAVHLVGPTGRIPAGLSYEEDSRSVVLRPLRPLPPGDYELRVAGRMLQGTDGRPVDRSVKLPFTIGQGAGLEPELIPG